MKSASLSPAARKLLRGVRQRLIQGELQVRKKTGGPVLEEILYWCDQQDIHLGSRLSHQDLSFDSLLLGQIEKTLKELGQQPLNSSLTSSSRQEQAQQGLDEFKNQGETPREQRLLLSLPAPVPGLDRLYLQPPKRVFIDLDWRDLDLTAFAQLVAVENLDAFYDLDLQAAQLPFQQAPALVVYRGDQQYRSGFEQLKTCWRATRKPCVYLGDLDAMGVNIALNGGYSHLLVPSLDYVQDQAAALHQPAQQLRYQKTLREKLQQLPASHPLAAYLQLIIKEQKGLKQQWFPEVLESLALS